MALALQGHQLVRRRAMENFVAIQPKSPTRTCRIHTATASVAYVLALSRTRGTSSTAAVAVILIAT